jgi:C-terminal processing protease CtpA/Prc
VISGNDTVGYDGFYSKYPINFNYRNINDNYLGSNYKTSGPFVYKIMDNVGYIYYSSFKQYFSDAELDKVMQDMKSTKGLIMDIRSNFGGNSANVDKLASWFFSEKKLVKYEVRKSGPGHSDFSDPLPYYIEPSAIHYDKPVIVLTNRSCFSACNDFVLYLSELSNVRLYGDQTGGGGAIPGNYVLANGWKIQYSSTVTLSPSMKNVENGILPDVRIEISGLEESRGIDPIIDRAFLALK